MRITFEYGVLTFHRTFAARDDSRPVLACLLVDTGKGYVGAANGFIAGRLAIDVAMREDEEHSSFLMAAYDLAYLRRNVKKGTTMVLVRQALEDGVIPPGLASWNVIGGYTWTVEYTSNVPQLGLLRHPLRPVDGTFPDLDRIYGEGGAGLPMMTTIAAEYMRDVGGFLHGMKFGDGGGVPTTIYKPTSPTSQVVIQAGHRKRVDPDDPTEYQSVHAFDAIIMPMVVGGPSGRNEESEPEVLSGPWVRRPPTLEPEPTPAPEPETETPTDATSGPDSSVPAGPGPADEDHGGD